MICYTPFTILDERQIGMLADVPDALTVYSPAQAIVPEQMLSWEAQGKLNICYPEGVNGEQLVSAIRNYKAWADLHQGRIGDMAGFFQAQQGRIPMVDDTNPTQIGHQIRHYGETPEAETVDPLFKAALFLSMAQEYDLHHHRMTRDMHAVDAMEQKMLKQMTCGDRDADMEMPALQSTPSSTDPYPIDDPYMISQRVRAWSRLALEDPQTPLLYLTLSKTVAEHILDFYPDAKELPCEGRGLSRIYEDIQTLAFEKDLEPVEWTSDIELGASVNCIGVRIYCLAGVSPLDFLTKLTGQDTAGEVAPRQGRVPANTFMGLVTTGN